MALVVAIQQAKAIPYYPPLKGDQIQKEIQREKEIGLWRNSTSLCDQESQFIFGCKVEVNPVNKTGALNKK
jgi:hypothetical protein